MNYHGVISEEFPFSLPYHISESMFREHMQHIASNFECLDIDGLCAILDGEKSYSTSSVAITFDDGYANNLYRAAPILEEFDVPATVFVVSGFVDSLELHWPERVALALAHTRTNEVIVGDQRFALESPEARTAAYEAVTRLVKTETAKDANIVIDEFLATNGLRAPSIDSLFGEEFRFLKGVELAQLAEHEFVTIGSHSVNHPRLKTISSDVARREIVESRQRLESLVGGIDYFAYPFGGLDLDFDKSHIAMVRESGYSAAFAIGSGGAVPGCNAFAAPRVNITSETDVTSLDYLATGGDSITENRSATSLLRGVMAGTIAKTSGH